MAPPGVAQGLPCMNCHQPVEQSEAKVFAEVFVCPTCFTVAERTYQKLEAELRKLLLMSKEAIRIALVQGKLHLAEAGTSEVSKSELLKMIMQLSEKQHEQDTAGPPRG